MGKLFEIASKQHQLFQAWRRIRENGYASSLEETRWAVEQFDRQADRGIKKLQRQLRNGTFEFEPQIGVAKKKANGNGKRGIVMASIHNRIVERALLDTLQSEVPFIKSVITMQTSVGGVPERSVPHGLKIIDDAISEGYDHFVRSDISGFFDAIPRKTVLDKISTKLDDERFLGLLNRATTVVLANESVLGEDRKIFPTDEEGVAQGSPLSPLFGNILLYDFDLQFNNDGVLCVRFIDDFVLLSKDGWRAKKAFQNAKAHLDKLGLKCHDPFLSANKEKAEQGKIGDGFIFLGYDIRPGLRQPSQKARNNLLAAVRDRIKVGKKTIGSAMKVPGADNTQRYAQTQIGIDRVLRGWGNAFAYGNSSATIEDLDLKVEKEISDFRNWYSGLMRDKDWKIRRRTGGICLLADIRTKDLSEVPFKLEASGRFVQSSKTITISTDGSVEGSRRQGRDRGPGGWAFVIHETDEVGSGFSQDATNNQMELQAVIEAIKAAPIEKSICIRTDSQYVQQIAKGANIAKSNNNMWREYESLTKGRKIKIVWIKGHSDDVHNERADKLAKQRSLEASQLNKVA